MATIYDLKPRFQALLRPLVARLARAGVTANQVTLAACLLSVAVGLWLAFAAPGPPAFALLPVVLFVRMAMNAADGMLAREFGQASALGAVLNEITDLLSDAVLALPFAYLPGVPPLAIAGFILLAALVELAGLSHQLATGTRSYAGPLGKSDRAFALGAWATWVALGLPASPAGQLLWLGLLTLLLLLTLWNRLPRPPKKPS